jgi:hypothetical protein
MEALSELGSLTVTGANHTCAAAAVTRQCQWADISGDLNPQTRPTQLGSPGPVAGRGRCI